jgi:clan AA aspartic protease (TIGR02281 family)
MSLLNGKIGIALCFAFLVIFGVRIIDNFSRKARFDNGTLVKVESNFQNEKTARVANSDKQKSDEEDQPRESIIQIENNGLPVIIFPENRQGFYDVDARVNNTRISFAVDPQGSLTLLRQSDAGKANLQLHGSDFNYEVNTQNGPVRAARVTLRQVEIKNYYATEVPALVLPDNALQENFLALGAMKKFGTVELAEKELRLTPNAEAMERPKPVEREQKIASQEPVDSFKSNVPRPKAGKRELDKSEYSGYSD